MLWCGNFRGSAAHGAASATKRTALRNFANSRIVSGLLKGNRLPDVRQLQKSMKLLKVLTDSMKLRWCCWLGCGDGGGSCCVAEMLVVSCSVVSWQAEA